jgi:hypothetical protein
MCNSESLNRFFINNIELKNNNFYKTLGEKIFYKYIVENLYDYFIYNL